jgi:hypothetical protein
MLKYEVRHGSIGRALRLPRFSGTPRRDAVLTASVAKTVELLRPIR